MRSGASCAPPASGRTIMVVEDETLAQDVLKSHLQNYGGWELVGVCSYLLIGFQLDDGAKADAATKAFLVNRIGDVGMLVALGLIMILAFWPVWGAPATIAQLRIAWMVAEVLFATATAVTLWTGVQYGEAAAKALR